MRRFLSAALVAAITAATHAAAPDVSTLQVPPGFKIAVFADPVPSARAMALGEQGTLFVGSRIGSVYAIRYDGDRSTRIQRIAEKLDEPIGVAFKDGALYVSATSRILRYAGIEQHLDHPPKPTVFRDGLPSESHHGGKFLAFGPDGGLYVAVGSPCNVCEPDERHGAIFRIAPDGKAMERVAHGVRNSVGFDWNPADGSLWFTDNGRDLLGDDLPPDELNRVDGKDPHFGFPYCHGGTIPDPEFGKSHRCDAFVPPEVRFGAHVAPLGMRFYTGTLFPADYRGDVFVAQHGSWNRSKKTGDQVVRVHLENGHAVKTEPFVSGWLRDETYSGRPSDVLVMPDGALLVADDAAGVIYRVGR
jgi:glucose/arabinose dehydrogenase